MAFGLSVFAALAAVLVLPPQDASVSFLSDRFAIRTGTDSAAELQVYDEAGTLMHALPLGERNPIAGFGGVALVGKPDAAGSRSVEVFDTGGIPIGRFAIPSDRQLIIGRESVALMPATPHEIGTQYSIQYLTLTGGLLTRQEVPEAILWSMEGTAGGHFLAYSTDNADSLVTAYGPDGTRLWTKRGESPGMPQACIANSGNSAVVWSISKDRSTSLVHLLDPQGNDRGQLELSAVHSAAYCRDDSELVLAGWDFVAIVDVPTMTIRWSSTAQLDQPAGQAMLVSDDGRQVDLLTRPTDDATHPELRTIVRPAGSTDVQDARRTLEPVGNLGRVLGLAELANRDLRIVTTAGEWRVER